MIQRVLSLFAAGLAEEGKRFADAALRITLPTVEEARVRLSVATMFDISPEIRAETARAGLALPDLEQHTDLTAWLWTALFHSLTVAGRTEEAIAIQPKAQRPPTRVLMKPVGWPSNCPSQESSTNCSISMLLSAPS